MSSISFIILKCFGWKATGHEKLYALPKFIVAIVPHTSNWDFIIGILIRSAYHLQKIKYLGKESLFKPPFGFIFKALGGFPVKRNSHINQVDLYIHEFQIKDEFAIVLAPEGTRKKVNQLKTGYYYIAKGAMIPIVPTIMNYQTKTVDFGKLFYPGTNEFDDLNYLNQLFKSRVGKYPGLSYGA